MTIPRPLIALLVVTALAAPVAGSAEDPAPPEALKPAVAPPKPAGQPSAAPPAAPAAQNEEIMVGEVVSLPYNRSAAYSVTRVTGPAVNVTDSGDGTWKGNIRDFSGVFKVTESRISAAGINMVMDRDGEEWVCQGTVDGKRVRFAMSKEGFVARYDNRLYDMKRMEAGLFATPNGGPALRVKGDAQQLNPFYPQFIFALLAIL
ncbi:MAG TPA: hypothetical protein PLL32_06955 [Anaeromyxobacteraceae bacterium]|nr:hypothetical protein [Anaeromyxobacteraceae bacterium]